MSVLPRLSFAHPRAALSFWTAVATVLAVILDAIVIRPVLLPAAGSLLAQLVADDRPPPDDPCSTLPPTSLGEMT